MDEKPQKGTLKQHFSGSFEYTPFRDYVGIDSFKIRLDINGEVSEPVYIDIEIEEISKPSVRGIPVSIPKEHHIKKGDLEYKNTYLSKEKLPFTE